MRDRSDRYQLSGAQPAPHPKRLGGYLIEAGLITPDQVSVALNDQQATGMRFGDVLVARGWLKEQTVEWIMQKVIVPERQAYERLTTPATIAQTQTVSQPASRTEPVQVTARSQASLSSQTTVPYTEHPAAVFSFSRREVPISKPLPPVNASDEDVNWVG